MDGLASEEKTFKLNPLRDREPVEALEDGGDVLVGAGVGILHSVGVGQTAGGVRKQEQGPISNDKVLVLALQKQHNNKTHCRTHGF